MGGSAAFAVLGAGLKPERTKERMSIRLIPQINTGFFMVCFIVISFITD
jgi:hypothetical protein